MKANTAVGGTLDFGKSSRLSTWKDGGKIVGGSHGTNREGGGQKKHWYAGKKGKKGIS